ncbi:TVP38/TMEM64 family protein [Paenibacillus segetis]|uniref:TVP38/TMEM64 family protein n=1 Tax=Paenibacillus segetis TaxID=1325360 RepID=UPI00166DB608|nr:VTT domain-containing protein [Paenibacillus segetis]
MDEWIQQMTEWLVETTQLGGFSILLLTIPLAIIQGVVGFFPFATLLMLHLSVLGVAKGLFASWLVGTIAGTVIYLLCQYLLADWFNRKWMKKLEKYHRWQESIDRYGVWAVIFLRTIPVMPNNLISFMSAISNMKTISYTWANLIGNLSSIWLFGIISAPIVFPDIDLSKLITSYVLFLFILGIVFIIRHRQMTRRERRLRVNK